MPLRFYFEKSQKLKFEVKDTDKGLPTKSMGFVETSLTKIINAKQNNLELAL